MEPSEEAVAIENSHQHNGTKSRATKRLAVNTVSSAHTLVIFKALEYKGKIAEQKVLKLSIFNEELYGTDKLIGNKFLLSRQVLTGQVILQNFCFHASFPV